MKLLFWIGVLSMAIMPVSFDTSIEIINDFDHNNFRVPIKVKDHIYVDLVIENRVMGSFLFDTGANGIILDGSFARKNGIPVIPSEQIFGEKKYSYGGGEGMMETEYVRNLSADLHTINLDSENVRVLELNSLLGESLGHQIDGIVGFDVFEDYLIDIRFDLGYMRFVKKLEDVQINNYAKLPYNNNYRKPIVPITLNLNNGENFEARCIFDLGSGGGLALNSRKVFDEALMSKTDIYDCDDDRLGGIGGQSSSCYARIKSIEIGEQLIFEGLELEISRDKRGALGWHDMYDGLLGMEVLRHYNVVIDQAEETIYLGVPAAKT